MNPSDRTAPISLWEASRRYFARLATRTWDHPLFVFCFLIPLSIAVFGQKGTLLVKLPPIVPLTAIFLLVAYAKGGLNQVVSAWRASPAVLWLYLLICAVEAVLMVLHRNPNGWFYVGGRVTFFIILLTITALCDDAKAAWGGLLGVVCGAGVIALLTIVQASRLVSLPFAGPLWPVRTFGTIQMPFPRTVGLDMTPDKFGILAAVALAMTMARGDGREWPMPRRWVRVLLFATVTLAALVTQTRGVYLTVAWALGLAAALALVGERVTPRLAHARAAWLLAGSFIALLALANVVFPFIAPDWLVNVGTAESVDGVSTRLGANAIGWLVFKRSPLIGIGHGTFREVTGFWTGIHNHFWEQIVATGIIGGLPYLLFHALILIYALQLLGSTRAISRAAGSVLVVGVSSTYLAYQFFPGFFTSVFAAVCGLVVSLRQEEQLADKLLAPEVCQPLRGTS